jgi:prophage regulatory protein
MEKPLAAGDLLLRPQLRKLVPLADVTVWRLEKRGLFPGRISLGANRVAWHRVEVEDWLSSRMAQRASEPKSAA